MRRCVWIIVIFAGLCGAEEKSAALPVEKLLQQLRSDDFELREKAQSLLMDAGEPARTALEKALTTQAEADFITRLKRILEKIDSENHIRRFDTVRRVDLQYKGSLQGALDHLKADFKCPINIDNDTLGQVAVDVSLKNASFFEALEAIRKSAKAGYSKHDTPNAFPLALIALTEKSACPAVVAGQFLFVLQSVGTNVERTLNFGEEKPNVEQRVNLTGTLISAPGVRLSAIGLHEVTLTDSAPETWHCDGNVSANSTHDGAAFAAAYNVNMNVQFQQSLRGPLSVKFNVLAMVPTKIEEKTIALSAKSDTVLENNGTKLSFKPVEQKGKEWEIPFSANVASHQLFSRSEQRSIKVKKKVKDPDDEDDEQTINESIEPTGDMTCSAGIYFTDAAGNRAIGRMTFSENTEDSCKGKMVVDFEPKSVMARSIVKREERQILIDLKGIPLP